MFNSYALFFFLAFLLFIIDWQVFKLRSSKLKIILAILYVLFAGLRYETGWDYEAYDYYFNYLDQIPFAKFHLIFLEGNYEPLFAIISFIAVKLYIPVYLLVAALTTYFYYAVISRHFSKYFYLIFLAYIYYGYFQQFSIIRQGLSVSLLYYAFLMVTNKRMKWLLCASSVLIHYSSVLSIFYFTASEKFVLTKKRLSIIVLVSLPFVLFKINLVSGLINLVTFERYATLTEIDFLNYKVGFSLKYVETILLLAGTVLYDLKNDTSIRFCQNLLLFELVNYSLFNDVTIIYERYNVIFEIAHAIIFAYVIMRLFRHQLLAYIFILSFIFYRYYQLFNSEARNVNEKTHYERFFPYRSILD